LQQAADTIGYGNASALSRAFTHYCGQSPRE
jgi:AraC-like DNA-binding protein